MIVGDWREADAGLLRGCYEAERRSWRTDLAWDTAWTWDTIERARTTWGLPGFVATDNGRIDGWTFYMRDGDAVHVGGLVAVTPSATVMLLDAIVEAALPGAAQIACFMRDRADGLAGALGARGFDVERFLYLSRPLSPADAAQREPSRDDGAAPWQPQDADAVAELLSAAYSPEAARHFAAGGSRDAWRRYVRGIVEQPGCGTLDRGVTRLVRDASSVRAVALVTSIAPDTAHLAQLAVHPAERGRGLGARLVRGAAARAAHAGKTALSLLVGERNDDARRLYASLGFVERGTFVSAQAPTVNFCPAVSGPRTRSAANRGDLHT